ncbi:MAG: MBL fold metallo-hydrolase [Planctomycetes bacterium]|nr:MBL fold metallo-hydrolase [Planctomycetota bacterium]MCC7170170.1 MBL fold metallo-hydrolase [Planctomycetota bacterium]
MPHPILKVVADQGCQSYLVGCPETRRALLVDPKVGRTKTIQDAASKFGLTIERVVDTHTHADHLSAGQTYAAAGLDVVMSRHTTCLRKVLRVGDGDEVRVGSLRLRVLEVPGHTPDSIALEGHGLAFVGDTLFAGSLARTDFRGASAAQLFESVTKRLLTLPDDTVVFAGHDYRDVLFTTIGHERRTNPALKHADAASYARATADVPGAGNAPEVDHMLALNQADDALPELPSAVVAACCAPGPSPANPAMHVTEHTVAELRDSEPARAAAGHWIDVRDPWEFAQWRIPGTRNLPLSELGLHLAEFTRGAEPFVFSCLGGVRSKTAAKTLAFLGVVDRPISLAGGINAWRDAGAPIERS